MYERQGIEPAFAGKKRQAASTARSSVTEDLIALDEGLRASKSLRHKGLELERVTRIELAFSAWEPSLEARVRPDVNRDGIFEVVANAYEEVRAAAYARWTRYGCSSHRGDIDDRHSTRTVALADVLSLLSRWRRAPLPGNGVERLVKWFVFSM
jgi:hypothetical protein